MCLSKLYLLLLFSLLVSCVSVKKYEVIKGNYEAFELITTTNCLRLKIEPHGFSEEAEGKRLVYYQKLFQVMQEVRTKDSVDIEIYRDSYVIGDDSAYQFYFWSNDGKSYLTNLNGFDKDTFNVKNLKILELNKREERKLLKIHRSINLDWYYGTSYELNCSNCIVDGGGEELFLKSKGSYDLVVREENCFNATPHVLGLTLYEGMLELGQLMEEIWEESITKVSNN